MIIIFVTTMQHDSVIQMIAKLPFPLIHRHDRALYHQHPQADPVALFKHCLVASFAGYWVGKFKGRKEGLLALVFPLPILCKFAWDEWKLSSTEGVTKYGEGTIKAGVLKSNRQ